MPCLPPCVPRRAPSSPCPSRPRGPSACETRPARRRGTALRRRARQRGWSRPCLRLPPRKRPARDVPGAWLRPGPLRPPRARSAASASVTSKPLSCSRSSPSWPCASSSLLQRGRVRRARRCSFASCSTASSAASRPSLLPSEPATAPSRWSLSVRTRFGTFTCSSSATTRVASSAAAARRRPLRIRAPGPAVLHSSAASATP